MAVTYKAGVTRERGLEGAAALYDQLGELKDGMAAKVLRGSVREAMMPTLGLWRASMATGRRWHKTYKGRMVGPGFSQRNSYIATQVARDGSRVSATVGPKDEAFYNAWFIETVGFTGGRGKRGKRTGRKVAPQPRLEPAFKAARGVTLSTLTAALRKRINAAVAKGKTR